MAFTYTKVNFLNDESYNEIKHATALASGWPNFIIDGFEFDDVNMTLTNGRGMNGGLPVILGRSGETQNIINNGTDTYIVLKTVLSGIQGSTNSIVMRPTKEVNNTDSVKEFPLYSINPATGKMLEDYRHSSFIKKVDFEDLGDDFFRLNINGTWSPPFNTSTLQSSWSKSDSDGRFKRVIDINSNFSDSEFEGMNMAQIMKYITDYVGNWGHTYEVVAECTNSTFPNVRDAVRSLTNEIFKANIMTPTVKFKMNRPRRSGLGGGDILEVGFDNNPMYYMQYDNYGDNWQTVNTDAFRAAQKRYGTLGVEEISSQDGTTNIKNNLKLDGTLYCDGQTRVLGGDLLTPFFHESSLTAVADETTLIKQNYNNGNASMTLGNLKAVSSERTYTNLTKYDTTGSANRAVLIFSSTASDAGMIHQVGDTNHKLAYNSDITREALQKDNEYLPLLVEMQKNIESIQGLKADSDLLTVLKTKQAKAEADLAAFDKRDKIVFAEEDLLQLQTDLADVRNIIIETKKTIDSIQELEGDSNLVNTLKAKQEKLETDLANLKQKASYLETQIATKEAEIATIRAGG